MPGEGRRWRTVKYPQYRQYNEARIATNDAMMALLVSARLANHTLRIHEGSRVMLPDAYPAVSGVQRMRRTIDDVRALIDGAEYQFASMSIPYTLAIYKELVVSALRMLQEDEVDTSSEDIHQLGLHDAQEHLIQFLDPAHIPHDELALLDFLRRLRNRIEHRGGIEGSSLRGAFQALSPSARQTWTTLAERPFESMGHTQPMRLDARELIATLAITTRLARAINRNLQVTLSRAYWARVAIRDFRRTSPKGWSQKDLRLRKARNFADHQYSALRLTEIELREAIATEES